jgi:hypothetical protein
MITIFFNVLCVALLLGFIALRWRSARSLLDPGIFFAVNLMLLYPVRGLILLSFGEDAQPDFPGVDLSNNLETTSGLALLGCFGYVVGYLVAAFRSSADILRGDTLAPTWDDVLVCAVFFAAAIVGIAYKFATGDYISYLQSDVRIEGLTQIGTILTGMQWPAFIGAWVLWFKGVRSPAFLVLFAFILIAVIPYQFIQGSKTFLSLLLVSGLLAFYWARGRLPAMSGVAAVALIALFIFPFVKGFRDYVNYEYGGIPTLSSFKTSEVVASAQRTQSNDVTSFDEQLFAISARYGGIDHLYGVTQTVPDLLPFNYGVNYFAVFVNFIPRAVWPSKPIFSRGADYGQALDTITSVTPFPIGEAYWDLGEAGVFVMMFVWGALLALMLRSCNSAFKRPNLTFFVSTFFLSQIYWVAGSEASMAAVIGGLPQQIGLLLFLYFVLSLVRALDVRLRS